jgi:hypothetical protein
MIAEPTTTILEKYHAALHHIEQRDLATAEAKRITAEARDLLQGINKNRQELKNQAFAARDAANKALRQHNDAINARAAELRRGRKGIPLPKLEFVDANSSIWVTADEGPITWASIIYNQDPTSTNRYAPDTAATFGLQTPSWIQFIESYTIQSQPLTPEFLQQVATGQLRTRMPQHPFHVQTTQGLYSHYSLNMFLDIRAFDRSHFDDIEYLTDAQIMKLSYIIHNPTDGAEIRLIS